MDIFESALEFLKGFFTNYTVAEINGVEQHSKQSRKPLNQQWLLKKAERHIYDHCVVSEQPSNSFKHFLLVTLPCMNDDIDIYTQRTTKLFTPTYHQVFCCPESVNTKRENLMIYSANFMQWVCIGYCESWILSLLSFIMNFSLFLIIIPYKLVLHSLIGHVS